MLYFSLTLAGVYDDRVSSATHNDLELGWAITGCLIVVVSEDRLQLPLVSALEAKLIKSNAPR